MRRLSTYGIFVKQGQTARVVQAVHKVSLQFQKFIAKANEKTDEWKLLQNEACIFKFFSFYLISCTKHIKTVLDFLHTLINGSNSITDPLL